MRGVEIRGGERGGERGRADGYEDVSTDYIIRCIHRVSALIGQVHL